MSGTPDGATGATSMLSCYEQANSYEAKPGTKDRRGADLMGANLSGADLTGSIFLRQAQLDSAKGDTDTKLSPSFTRPTHWQAAAHRPPSA
ncbi:MAG: pentapeptide repeat-containing protein [Pseudonocardiaceae bacterium]